MSPLERFLMRLGPGWFAGITLGNWLRRLAENHFIVSPAHWPRAACITLYSILNTPFAWLEALLFSRRLRSIEPPPPLFILGHPRSGTTHLQNVLSMDQRFAHPNFFQVNYPSTFLVGEAWASKIVQFFVPKRRFMDNVSQHVGLPLEEEWAMCQLTGQSPYVGWAFGRRLHEYQKYWTLQRVSKSERERWQNALLHLVKKLTLKHRKPLVLKSPPHTGRIQLLLELFPDAKFISIHRNPYEVFQSTRHLWAKVIPFCQLQTFHDLDVDSEILNQYREVHEQYFRDRALIPPSNIIEIAFADFEQEPIEEMRGIYQALRLPDFSEVEAAMRTYVAGLSEYKKNEHQALPQALEQRIATEWEQSFREWGYPMRLPAVAAHEPLAPAT